MCWIAQPRYGYAAKTGLRCGCCHGWGLVGRGVALGPCNAAFLGSERDAYGSLDCNDMASAS